MQFELDSARREQRKRGREFILPVRLDDTPLLGLPDSKIRIDARERSVAQIAKLFAEKCGARTLPMSRTSGTVRTSLVSLLKPDARRALSLIATAALPMPIEYLEKLFPKYDWRRLAAGFRSAGLTEGTGGFIELRRAASRALTSDPAAFKEFNQLWIDRLWPLQDHFDTAAFLVVHLITVRRFEEAAHVAATAAHAVEPGSWTDVYLALLRALRQRRSFNALSRQTRLELLNSLGTTLSHAGKHSEALRVFADLRRLSRSYRNSWGTGQALINAGVAAHNVGDTVVSVRMYEQAVTHAKRSRDNLLLGRALSNLAQSIEAEDLPRAERMLEESLRAKAKAHDSGGLAIGLAVRAGFAVSKRDFAAAAQLFKKASGHSRASACVTSTP
jgi:tetratricopeptide (TPR) repeat protein